MSYIWSSDERHLTILFDDLLFEIIRSMIVSWRHPFFPFDFDCLCYVEELENTCFHFLNILGLGVS